MDNEVQTPFCERKGMAWLLMNFIKIHKKIPPEKFLFFLEGQELPEGLPYSDEKTFSVYMGSMTAQAWELFHKTKGYYIDEAKEREDREAYPY